MDPKDQSESKRKVWMILLNSKEKIHEDVLQTYIHHNVNYQLRCSEKVEETQF